MMVVDPDSKLDFKHLASVVVNGLTVIGIIVILVLLSIMVPWPAQERVRPTRMICSNNLKQIGLALHTYLEVYGTFPPAYVADERGRPMHSWRVLLLPFLDQQRLYDQYNFEEPWDGPNNSKLHGTQIKAFQCLLTGDEIGTQTNYLAVTGDRCGFHGSTPLTHTHMYDGTGATMAVVEIPSTTVHWMSPVDLDVQQYPALGDAAGLGSRHHKGLNALFFDGSVHFLPNDIPQSLLNALYTRNGGELVPENFEQLRSF